MEPEAVMSMDDQYQHMVTFYRALVEFDNHLAASLRDLEEHHEAIDTLWNDDARLDYNRDWEPLHDRITDYLQIDSPRYQSFLEMKLKYLERYLRGG
jgi:hypothetical protein